MLLVAVLLIALAPLQGDAPGSLAHSYATAWNAHDATALGQLFTDDADWVTASGTAMRGRSAIEGYLQQEHRGWARATSMKVSDVRIRSLSVDLAVITFAWEITQNERTIKGSNMMVASREQGQWRILSGQVATIPPR